MREAKGLAVVPEHDNPSPIGQPEEMVVVEASLTPTSEMAGKTLRDVKFRDTYGLNVLAIWQVDNAFNITSSSYIPGPTSDWTFKSIADLNGDGKSDLLWQNSVTGALAPWYMNGMTVGSYATELPGPSSDWQLKALADFNGDGRADYLWQSTTKGALAKISGLAGAKASTPEGA